MTQGSDAGAGKRRTWVGAIFAGGIILVIAGVVVGAFLGFAAGAAIGAAVTETGSECQFEECVDPGILPGAVIGLAAGALIGGLVTGALWLRQVRKPRTEPAAPRVSTADAGAVRDADITSADREEPGGAGPSS